MNLMPSAVRRKSGLIVQDSSSRFIVTALQLLSCRKARKRGRYEPFVLEIQKAETVAEVIDALNVNRLRVLMNRLKQQVCHGLRNEAIFAIYDTISARPFAMSALLS